MENLEPKISTKEAKPLRPDLNTPKIEDEPIANVRETIYDDIVIAQAGGLRVIRPGISRKRYRQGV